jgi:hypothetical protein
MDKVQQFRFRYGEFIKVSKILPRGYDTKEPGRMLFTVENIYYICMKENRV